MKKIIVELTKEKFKDLIYYAKCAEENAKKLDGIFGEFSSLEITDKLCGEDALYFLMQFNWVYMMDSEGDTFWEEIKDVNIGIDFLVEKYWPGFEEVKE